MLSRQTQAFQTKTDWCYSCVNRVGIRRFRQLTINEVCQDCDKQIKPENKKINTSEASNISPTSQDPERPATSPNPTAQEIHQFLREEEQALIVVFQQLQSEMVGNLWRQPAAERLGWDVDKVRNIIKRVRTYQDLRPIPVENHLIKFVTPEYQTAKQITEKLNKFGVLWVYMNLEKLAMQQRIEKITNQPHETLYRLPRTD